MSKRNCLEMGQKYKLVEFLKGNFLDLGGLTRKETSKLITEKLGFTVTWSNIENAAKAMDLEWHVEREPHKPR